MRKSKSFLSYLLASFCLFVVIIFIAALVDPVMYYMSFITIVACPIHALICLMIEQGLRRTTIKKRKLIAFLLGSIAMVVFFPLILAFMTTFVW